MARVRTRDVIAGHREAIAVAATLGGIVRSARRARRCTLAQLAARVGLGVSRLSDIERGAGTRVPLETWIALGIALERPLAVSFSPALSPGSARDAGHLDIQECVLRLAQATGPRARSKSRHDQRTRVAPPTSGSATHLRVHGSSLNAGTRSAISVRRSGLLDASTSRLPRHGRRIGSRPCGSSARQPRIEPWWLATPPSSMPRSPGRVGGGSQR